MTAPLTSTNNFGFRECSLCRCPHTGVNGIIVDKNYYPLCDFCMPSSKRDKVATAEMCLAFGVSLKEQRIWETVRGVVN